MTLHSEDWAKLYGPLITELAKAIIGLIFGNTEKKTNIVNRYRDTKVYSADYHNTSGKFRW